MKCALKGQLHRMREEREGERGGGREPKEMEPVRVPGHAAGNNRSWNKEERGRAAAEAEAQFKTK